MPPEPAPVRTGIEWNKVTWYSKLGALVLFIGVIPALTFYIGMQYQAVLDTQTAVMSTVPTHSKDLQSTSTHYELGYGTSGKSVNIRVPSEWELTWLKKYELVRPDCGLYGFKFTNSQHPEVSLYSTCLGRGGEGFDKSVSTRGINGKTFSLDHLSYEGENILISTSYDGIPFTLENPTGITEALEAQFYEILGTIEN